MFMVESTIMGYVNYVIIFLCVLNNYINIWHFDIHMMSKRVWSYQNDCSKATIQNVEFSNLINNLK